MSNFQFWYRQSFFNKDEIKSMNEFVENNFDDYEEKTKANYIDTKNALTKCISYGKIKNFLCDLIEYYYAINSEHFGYDLYPMNNNFSVNYNIYNKNSEYKWHNDVCNDLNYDIKFTILINVSENYYTGGQFQLFDAGECTLNTFNNPGDTLMFKSDLFHRVTPIENGERKTLAIFLRGPKFR